MLALHENGLLERCREVLSRGTDHRAPEVNKSVLPYCQRIVEAIGHRMAYDAAVSVGLSQGLIDLFVASIVQLDQAWYSENVGFNTLQQEDLQGKALDAILPHVEDLVRAFSVDRYVSAPIVSDKAWDTFVDDLEVFGGRSRVSRVLEDAYEFPRPHL